MGGRKVEGMSALLPALIVFGRLAAVMGLFAWLARVIRRHGGAGAGMAAALAAYEDAFRATSHASHHEIRARAERKAPADSPEGRRRRRGEG